MKQNIFLTLLFSIIFVSCAPIYDTIEPDELYHAFILNSSPTFKGYIYQGSDVNYHYFISKWDYQIDNHFKIKKGDLKINDPYKFKQKEVRVDLFKTDKLFGNNRFCTLYITE